MNKEQIIAKARKKLPFTSEVKTDRYVVGILDETVLPLSDGGGKPSPFSLSFHQVMFRKQIVSGIVIGWEFEGMTRL